MSEVAWNALMQAPNPGEAFTNAYQGGLQRRQQQQMQQQAMQEHQEDRALRQAQMQQQAHMQQLEQHKDKILMGAKLVRQIQPKDQAGWDQVRGLAQQAGIDLSDVPAQFDPNYVQGLTSLADAWEPQKQEAQPNIAKEVAYYRSIGRPELADQLLQRHAEGGPIVANNGDGTFTIIPRTQGQQQGGPQPGAVEDGYRFKGGNPADPNAWEPVGQGGQTVAPSGPFPPAGN